GPGILLLMATSLLLINILAHVNTRFRDAANMSALVMQVLFYATPVIFPAEMLRRRGLDPVVDLNPAYHLLEVVRRPLLAAAPARSMDYGVSGAVVAMLAGASVLLIARYGRRIVFAL